MEEQIEKQDKAPVIGKFKTKGKFVSFMSATQGRVRLFRETAYIDGSQLSGLFDKTKFKMTICDEGTVDFEEVDTDIADEAMLKRLVQQIEDAEVTGYANKFITSGFTFKDEDGSICYLEVEHQKPIDRLRSLFDEPEISEKGLSALDLLFGGDEESLDLSEEDAETIVEEVENPSEPNEKLKSAAESYIEESFRKMNEQKVNELKVRIEKAERELNKTKFELSTAETKVKKTTEELKVLNSRMETLVPSNEPNGIVFHVSEEKKHETGLDENTKHVADKIADLLGLKKDVLFTQLTSGFYEINITDKREDYSKEDEEKEVELNKIINDIKSIDIEGKFEIKPEGGVVKITYTGELNWHEITSKMIRKGFEQDEEFDKFVGSNSYTSKVTERGSEEDEDFEIGFPKSLLSGGEEDEEDFDDDFDEEEDEKDEVPADFHTKELMTFEEPTDLVIWTEPSIGNYGDADITLTDDYATLGLRSNGNYVLDMETAGFASITTFEKYKKFLDEEGEEGRFGLEATEAVLIPDFKGTITVGIELDKGGYAVDFDTNEDLMHTSEGSGAPFLDFPSGTQMIFIEDHDLNNLKGFLRDKKLKSLGIN